MSKLSFKFKRLDEENLLVFAKNVLTLLSTNAVFESLKALYDGDLKTAVEEYSALLEAAKNGNHATIAEKKAARLKLLAMLTEAANGVSYVAKGNAAIILLGGFKVLTPGHQHKGSIGPVTGFTASRTENPNEVLCKWNSTPFADKYALEYTADGGEAWHNGTYSSASKIVVKGLPGRQDIMLRACALGTAGKKGPWCDPVTVFVL